MKIIEKMKFLSTEEERYNYFLSNQKKYNDFMEIVVGSMKEDKYAVLHEKRNKLMELIVSNNDLRIFEKLWPEFAKRSGMVDGYRVLATFPLTILNNSKTDFLKTILQADIPMFQWFRTGIIEGRTLSVESVIIMESDNLLNKSTFWNCMEKKFGENTKQIISDEFAKLCISRGIPEDDYDIYCIEKIRKEKEFITQNLLNLNDKGNIVKRI